jgi:hypothetical protein
MQSGYRNGKHGKRFLCKLKASNLFGPKGTNQQSACGNVCLSEKQSDGGDPHPLFCELALIALFPAFKTALRERKRISFDGKRPIYK